MALKYGVSGGPVPGVEGATGEAGTREPQGTRGSGLVGRAGTCTLTRKPQEPLQKQSGTWMQEGGHQAGQHRPRGRAGVWVNPGGGLRFQALGLSLLSPQPALGLLLDTVGRTQAGLGCQPPSPMVPG